MASSRRSVGSHSAARLGSPAVGVGFALSPAGVPPAVGFALAFGFVTWGLWQWIGRPRSEFDRLAIIVGACFVGYNLFLLFIFVAHFGGHPQSYWRFNTHLGYLIVASAIFGLGIAYRSYSHRLPDCIKFILKSGAMALVIVLPLLQLGLANYWRFDLEIPKPLLREVGRDFAEILPRSARIAAIVPSDQGNFTSILRHYALQERPDLDLGAVNNPSQLDGFLDVLSEKPTFVWAYCPNGWLARSLEIDVPHGHAALLAQTVSGWKVEQLWQLRTPGHLIKVYKLFNLSKCTDGI